MDYYEELMFMNMGVIPYYDDVIMSVDLGDLFPLIFEECPTIASSCRDTTRTGTDALPGEAVQETRTGAVNLDAVEKPAKGSRQIVGIGRIHRVSDVLREMIEDIAMQLKRSISVPIKPRYESSKILGDGHTENMRMNHISVPSSTNGRKRTRDQLIERTSASFKLPDGFDAGTELDKLQSPDHLENQVDQDTSNTHQFCFLQRLQGWNIECREDAYGEDEMYYYHTVSRKMLRSVGEVVDFMMFEIYPDVPVDAAKSLSP